MLATAAIILLAGCAAPARDAGGFADEATLGPHGFTEWNVRLAENESIEWALSSDVLVRWDVHSHPGGELFVHARGEGTKASGDFLAPRADVYSVSALAASAQTRVSIRIQGDFEVVE